MKRALITGITGQDGSYLAELLLEQGLRGARHRPPLQLVQHRAARPHLPGPARRPTTGCACVYGDLDDAQRAEPRGAHDPPRRDLQPGRAEPRARQLRRARVHGVDGRPRDAAPARGDPRVGPRQDGALLPGVVERDVRRRQAAAERGHAVPAAQPVRLRQGVRPPALPELPRGLRDVHLPAASCSTTSRRGAGSRSSRARSPAPRRASSTGWRRSCTSATSTPSATGASPATTSRRCG